MIISTFSLINCSVVMQILKKIKLIFLTQNFVLNTSNSDWILILLILGLDVQTAETN